MNASGPKERATFSIDSTIKETLESQVPKSKRSRFVEEAIAKALKDAAKERALKMIREFKPISTGGEDSTTCCAEFVWRWTDGQWVSSKAAKSDHRRCVDFHQTLSG